MTKNKIKNILDFIPLSVLTISAIILLWKVATVEIDFLWQHIVALILLPINYLLFFWRHKVGVLGLGLTLVLGLFNLLSFSPAITTTTLYKGTGDGKLLFFLRTTHFSFMDRIALYFIRQALCRHCNKKILERLNQ